MTPNRYLKEPRLFGLAIGKAKAVGLVALFLIAGAVLRFYDADRPLVGFFDGGRIGLHMQNLKELPVSEHRFRMIDNPNPISSSDYPNHPPLVVFVSLAFSYLFRSTEFAIRLGGILCSLLTVTLLYSIGRRVANTAVGVGAAFLASIVPLSSFYGATAFNHDVASVFFAVALMAVFVMGRWNALTIVAMALCVIGGAFSDVHFNYLPFVAAFVYGAIYRDREKFRLALVASVFDLVAFASWLGYVQLAYGNYMRPFAAGANRMGHGILLHADFYRDIWNYLLVTVTWPAAYALVAFVIWAVVCKRTLQRDLCAALLIFLGFGTLPVVLFPSGAEIHIFWIYPLLPFLSLAFGALVQDWKPVLVAGIMALISYASVREWVAMRGHNAYEYYAAGEYVSSHIQPSETVLTDFDPNLLYFYVRGKITNVDVLPEMSKLLDYAKSNNVRFIVLTGRSGIYRTTRAIDGYTCLWRSGHFQIFARSDWLRKYAADKSGLLTRSDTGGTHRPGFVELLSNLPGDDLPGLEKRDLNVVVQNSNNEVLYHQRYSPAADFLVAAPASNHRSFTLVLVPNPSLHGMTAKVDLLPH